VDSTNWLQKTQRGEFTTIPRVTRFWLVGILSKRILQAVHRTFGRALTFHNILKTTLPESDPWLVKKPYADFTGKKKPLRIPSPSNEILGVLVQNFPR